MAETVYSLGVSFCSDEICFTNVSYNDGLVRLENTDIIKSSFNFSDEMGKHKSNQKELMNISSEIKNYIEKSKLNIENVSVSIGTEQAFIITLPVDHSEGRKSLNSKIYWELSNYFPDNYTDYVINTYRMNKILPCKNSDEYLIIAVHKNTIEFLKRIFKMSGLELTYIDIDHFSAENTLRKNHTSRTENRKILLVGLKENRIDYGFIDCGKYCYYGYSVPSSKVEYNLNLTKKINHIHDTVSSQIDLIYLYGSNIPEDSLKSLRELSVSPVDIINPFENIKASDFFLRDENLRKDFYRYTVSCGVALRKIFP
ncbi:MAG: hypothetical protein N2510_08975 [Ignavibacteria bacterium]|nr:hypothetical protein [Ignavibacteria bacterium]